MALSATDIERHIRHAVAPSNPLRNMTVPQLVREQEWLEHLASQTAIANLEAFLDANESFLEDAAVVRDAGLCVARIRQRKPEECIVVDVALSAQLDLRLQLCRVELSRRRARSTRDKPRTRIH